MATKNTAANISRIGAMRSTISWASWASATIAPMRKAPSAIENPRCAPNTAKPNARPRTETVSISLR